MKLGFIQVRSKIILLLAAVSLMVAAASRLEAAESIRVVSPAPPHFAGQPLLFHIQLREFFQPRRVTVFYRSVGVAVFRQLNLAKERPFRWQTGPVSIPPDARLPAP